jgi:predicted alpha/beta superfamily hydrolase
VVRVRTLINQSADQADHASTPRREDTERTMKRQQVALTAYVLSPLVVTVLLCWAIVVSIREPRKMDVPPIGAGAGDTGGANAIGQLLATGSAKPAVAEYSGRGMPAGYGKIDGGPVEPESLPQGFLLVVEDASTKASASSPIFLACNWNNWNPSDPAFRLEPQSDMRWRLLVKRPEGRTDRLEFKFTRGDWALEELNDDLSATTNRSLPAVDPASLKDGEPPKFELRVAKWGDQRPEFAAKAATDPYRALKVTGEVRRLQVSGGPTAGGQPRDVLVWLPPGYSSPSNASARYPVLYLHDGQNLFEQHPGIAAEWKVDEIATSLVHRHMMAPTIIVRVPHTGAGRISEYLPVPALEGVEPRGDAHIAWLLSEVKPRVDSAFRVRTGPEHTGIGGASLGAAVALRAAARHPDVFGVLLAESLPLRTGDPAAWDGLIASVGTWPRRTYVGGGGSEYGTEESLAADNARYVQAVKALDARMEQAGLGPDRKLVVLEPAASHTEAAWSARLPRALSFLFPPPMDGTK